MSLTSCSSFCRLDRAQASPRVQTKPRRRPCAAALFSSRAPLVARVGLWCMRLDGHSPRFSRVSFLNSPMACMTTVTQWRVGHSTLPWSGLDRDGRFKDETTLRRAKRPSSASRSGSRFKANDPRQPPAIIWSKRDSRCTPAKEPSLLHQSTCTSWFLKKRNQSIRDSLLHSLALLENQNSVRLKGADLVTPWPSTHRVREDLRWLSFVRLPSATPVDDG